MQFNLFDEIHQMIRDTTLFGALAFFFGMIGFVLLVHYWIYFAYVAMHV